MRCLLLFLALVTCTAQAQTHSTLTVTVQPGERQTFGGLGASLGNWGRDYQKLDTNERTKLSQWLWGGLKMKTLRLWLNLNEYAPTRGQRLTADFKARYVESGIINDAQKNGVVNLLLAPDNCPDYLKVKREGGAADFAITDEHLGEYTELLADFIAQIKKETGILIGVTGLQNEPNDLDRLEPRQFAPLIKSLRVALDERGLKNVKIIATENSNVDDSFYAQLDAIKADPAVWKMLDGIASHSYNMAATERAATYVAGTNKTYWMTEASDNGPEVPGDSVRAASLASRFLSDMNHGVTHWIHFLGFEVPDSNDNATRIIAYTTTPFATTEFQKYNSYSMLSQNFAVGAKFRYCLNEIDGDMAWTFGSKPHLSAAAAKNPDGNWAIGLSNFTAPEHGEALVNRKLSEFYGSEHYDVRIEIPELKNVASLTFFIHHETATGASHLNWEEMKNGVIIVPDVAPLDLVVLRTGVKVFDTNPMANMPRNAEG